MHTPEANEHNASLHNCNYFTLETVECQKVTYNGRNTHRHLAQTSSGLVILFWKTKLETNYLFFI